MKKLKTNIKPEANLKRLSKAIVWKCAMEDDCHPLIIRMNRIQLHRSMWDLVQFIQRNQEHDRIQKWSSEEHHIFMMTFGVMCGWWADWNKKEPIDHPIIMQLDPNKPEEHNWQTVAVEAGLFDSKGEAKRAGIQGPITEKNRKITGKNVFVI